MSDDDEITRLWSDEELDEALRDLHAEPRDPGSALATARAKVLAAASGDPISGAIDAASAASADKASPAADAAAEPGHRRRRWIRVALAVGIAAVLVTIGLLIPSFFTIDRTGTHHSKPVNSAEAIGVQASPYGVAVEVWAQAVVNGKAANTAPFWHYLFPYATFRLDGDRVLENGALATVFVGTGGGNAAFGTGPNLDTTGVSPTPSDTAWDWTFPELTSRPYLYVRSVDAPVGLKGCFANLGIPLTGITAGTPATLTPSNGTRPASLAALTDLGALGNTTAWLAGQYIVLRDGSEAYWDSNSWEQGRKPATVITATGAVAGDPGHYTPTGAANPANLAALSTVTANPTSAWTTGQFVNVADGTRANWTGSAWAAGEHA